MKIEKITKDNLDIFLKDLKIEDDCLIDKYIKEDLFGISIDEVFYLGFINLSIKDNIALVYYSSKLNTDIFFECIEFLRSILVVESNLIINLWDRKFIKIIEEKYKCKDISLIKGKPNDDFIPFEVLNVECEKEKFIDIGMNSIKYISYKDFAICNLFKQNVQDENFINNICHSLDELKKKCINIVAYPDNLFLLEKYGYKCISKSYIIRNDL